MNSKLLKYIACLFLSVAALSCNDGYNDQLHDPVLIDDGVGNETAIDMWLKENFLTPFNIEVKYKWDASEVDLYKSLVPPRVDKVKDVMGVVKRVWIDPYVTIAGKDFISQYCPKQFVMVGSPRYNFDGSLTLGTAEGGRKVVLYVVNDFAPGDQFKVKQMIHTIEHEFTHILNQTIAFPSAFKEVTPGAYTANWSHVPLNVARESGFISSYAMASADEDFAEMVSMMLVEGKRAYENILSCETTNASYAALRKKEQIVVDYFNKAFGIDFYKLQGEVQKQIADVAPGAGGDEPPPVLLKETWGFNKAYKVFNIDMLTIQQSNEFATRFIIDNQALHAYNLALDVNFSLAFTEENVLTLTLYYYNIGAETRTYKRADFLYSFEPSLLEDTAVRISSVGGNDNALELLEKGVVYVPGYFHNDFNIDWATTCSGYQYAGLFPLGAAGNYCLGILGN